MNTTTMGSLFLLATCSALGIACGSSPAPDGTAGGGGGVGKSGSGGNAGNGGNGGTGGLITGCSSDADCPSGDACSETGHCVPAGNCGSDADCAAGEVCAPETKTCGPGSKCGENVFQLEAVASNMFISLDRSCSMHNDGGGGQSKWQIAVAAVNGMLTDFKSKIRWGLALFPDTDLAKCEQSAPQVPVNDGNEAAIQTLLSASLQATDPFAPNGPCVTNIDTAMLQASQEASLNDLIHKGYVILLTDGAQAGCSANGGDTFTLQIIGDMAKNDIHTFVIGFGSNVKAASLNKFADAGGVPNVDPAHPAQHYYQADDAQSLQAALGQIAGSVIGCTFTLDPTPPDASQVYVFFDKLGVPRDAAHLGGWDYDPASNQLTFYGSECKKLEASQVSKVDVVFGCNAPPPH
jgi:Cys-rich repeat protein